MAGVVRRQRHSGAGAARAAVRPIVRVDPGGYRRVGGGAGVHALAERKRTAGRSVRPLPEARDVVYAAHFLMFPHIERHRLGLMVFIEWLSAEFREVVWDEDVRLAPFEAVQPDTRRA